MQRNNTREVKVGNLKIGGSAPVTIQSMCTTYTEDVISTVRQINALQEAGCEIVRLAVPTMEAAEAIAEIKMGVDIPLVADIHFDYRLALTAIESGVDKVRLNPGNIGSEKNVKMVLDALKERSIPMRIGVNSGSVEPKLLQKYAGPKPEAMVESALKHVAIAEKYNFEDIVISIKSSSVVDTIKAYQILSEKTNYPLHLGVTEVGTYNSASIKSAMGIGSLLIMGIGNTIRSSVTGDPLKEIELCKSILAAAEVRKFGMDIVSCPTCGRCQIDLEKIVLQLQDELKSYKNPLKVAVMGCVVNGPGEAREADLGIAGGKDEAVIFKKGKVLCKKPYEEVYTTLKNLIDNWESDNE